MTEDQIKETVLFNMIRTVLEEHNTQELTQELLNIAYRKTVEFYNDKENMESIKTTVKAVLKNEKIKI